jgi:hypothetical protein
MDTILITSQHTVETQHEIELPAYYKGPAHAYKIISKDKAIRVYYGWNKHERSVGIESSSQVFSGSAAAVPCSQNEFETIFMDAMVTLGEIAENGIVIENQIETI